MKKISIYAIIVFFLSAAFVPMNANAVAGQKFTVKLQKCIDGDTANFSKIGKARFLYIDTPESTNRIQPYGKTASNYTCTSLKHAKKIQVQYDGPKKDKYGRTLVWVWVDGKLLQKKLIDKGYVKGFYDYGTYSYEKTLRNAQVNAKKKRVGIWSNPKKNLASSVAKPSKKPAKKPAVSNKTNFKNCTELRKYYPNGVAKGHKAYQAKMDRDKDGYACER